MDFATDIDIAAPPERVWAVMRTVERWPEWTASVTRVERLSGGPPGSPIATGDRVRLRQPGFPPAVWTVTEVTEPGPPRAAAPEAAVALAGFTWVSTAPGLRVTARHAVQSTAGGCRATLTLHFAGLLGGLFGWLTQRVNRRYMGLEAEGLKRAGESGIEAGFPGLPTP